jgi:hypothetical protein
MVRMSATESLGDSAAARSIPITSDLDQLVELVSHDFGATDDVLREAHAAASTLVSDRHRSYLPGRLLPLLVEKFRDDVAEALGMKLPALPQRPPVRPVKLEDLASGELHELSRAVVTLVTRFTVCMDDPELPRLLRTFGMPWNARSW